MVAHSVVNPESLFSSGTELSFSVILWQVHLNTGVTAGNEACDL